jgi:hypothetical protein
MARGIGRETDPLRQALLKMAEAFEAEAAAKETKLSDERFLERRLPLGDQRSDGRS